MSDIISKNNIKRHLLTFMQMSFFSLMFFLIDIILLYFIGGSSKGILHIILTDIAIGVIFSSLLCFTDGILKKIFYVIANLFFSLYALIAFIEIYTKISFDTIYPFKTIIYNYRSVVSEYSSDIKDIIMSRGLIFLLLILIIIFAIYTSKVLYFDERIDMKERTSKNKIFSLVTLIIVIIVSSVTSIMSADKSSYNFTDLIMSSGLKNAVYFEYVDHDDFTFDMLDEPRVAMMTLSETDVIELKEEVATLSNADTSNSLDKTDVSATNAATMLSPVTEMRAEYINVNTFMLNRTPTGRNDYTGLFKGKNLIMICAEALNTTIVNEDLFPTLYRLIHNGFTFNNFYQPKEGSTSSGEYAFMTGMLPIYTDRSFVQSETNNMGFTIPAMLHNEGYTTLSFHNGTSTFYSRDNTHGELMGFDKFTANDTGLSRLTGTTYPNDLQLFEVTYDMLPKDTPYLAYYMTYSGHMPYTNFSSSNRSAIVDAYYGDTKSQVVKNYIAKNLLLEEGLTSLLNNLEKDGKLNDTVICIVPDHYPYGLYNANAVTGESTNYVAELYNDPDIDSHPMERDRNYLVLWSGSLENEYKDKAIDVNKFTATIDVTPTLLNLFDVPFDSRIYPGHDVFSNEEGIVIYNNGRYIATGDINEDGTINETMVAYHQAYVRNIINYCTFFIKNDYYGYLTGNKGNAQKICYLTFDGGPSDLTLEIMKILADYDASAGFFIVGEGKTEYIKDMKKKGHTIYPLADTYDYLSMYKDEETYLAKLESMRALLKANLDTEALLFRFPYGSGNTITKDVNPGIMTRLAEAVRERGYKYTDWSIESGDENVELTADQIVENVMAGVGNNDIICVHLHDRDENVHTLEALSTIIKKLKAKGYKFKAINRHSTNFKQVIQN